MRGGDNPFVISGHPPHLGGVSVKQPLLEISDIRLERSQSLVYIEIDLIGEAAWYSALTEFALGIDVGIKLVGITRKVRVVADDLRLVCLPTRSRAGNDGLEPADFAVLKGVGRLSEIVGEATGERKFVKRVNPIGTQIIEFPVGVHV